MLSKIFVYGSLNTPSNRFSRKLIRNSVLIGKGEMEGKLYNIGNYPGALNEPHPSYRSHGVFYQMNDISMLPALDNYEDYKSGNPAQSHFVRRAVVVRDRNGKVH